MISIPSKDGTIIYINPMNPSNIHKVRKTNCRHYYHSESNKGKRIHGFRRTTKSDLIDKGFINN